MKASKFFLAVAMVAMALPASAQFTGSHRNNNRGGKAAAAPTYPAAYNTIMVGYNAEMISSDMEGADDETANGFAAQFMHGWNIGNMPLYIEAGGRFAMGFYSKDDSYEEFGYKSKNTSDYTCAYLAIPVNCGYRFSFDNGMSLMPYAGLNAKINLMGKIKSTVEFDGESESETMDLFDKDDMGGSDNTANRLQIGMQIGARFNINKFCVGLEYGYDFSEYMKKVNTSHFALNVGLNF